MSTNSYVAVKTEKGYDAIYAHWDGYPSYMYPMLRDWYGTEERAKALVALGDASIIDKRLVPSQDSGHCFDHREEDVCVFYHRDRGEELNIFHCFRKDELFKRQFYVYIFEDGQWKAYEGGEEVADYAQY